MNKNWHDDVFFGLHTDLHANMEDKILGRDLTVEHLVGELRKFDPDFVQCDCKGHPGYTSYPTKVGSASPGIVKDSLKIWREATRELGIPLVVHYSGIWDTAALSRYPQWGRVGSGKNEDENGRSRDMVCPISDYTDKYMIPQLIEIIDEYDVDGFWVDGENWACQPCYCDVCREGFEIKTGRSSMPENSSDEGWDEWLGFQRENFEEHVRRYAKAVHDHKPGCTVCSNWMYTIRQPDDIDVPVDYISGDFDWTWSCTRASAEARFMDSRRIGWDLMAWGFTSHGPMKDWEFKTAPALCQEAAIVMSCGGAFMIYDNPERSGQLIGWHMDVIGETARFCRERERYCRDTVSVPQVAVIHTKEHFYKNNVPLYNFGNANSQIEGALHAFLENSMHVDIISGDDFTRGAGKYPLCILAEQDRLSDAVYSAAQKYVEDGGSLIVSGCENTRRFDDMLGVADTGLFADNEVFILQEQKTVRGIGKWRLVRNVDATEIRPLLYSRQTGEGAVYSGSPVATVRKYGKGLIAGIYGPLFGSYSYSHYPGIRRFIAEIVKAMYTGRLINIDAPACIAVSIREREKSLMVHMVNLGSSQPLSPKNTIVEDVPAAGPVEISFGMEKAPASVFLAPGAKPVKWSYSGGLFKARLDLVGIHDILIIDRG